MHQPEYGINRLTEIFHTLLGFPKGEKQKDESLRTMLSFDFPRGISNLSFTAAWVMDRMLYSNPNPDPEMAIDSRNLSEMLTLKAGYENIIGEDTKLKVGSGRRNRMLLIPITTIIGQNEIQAPFTPRSIVNGKVWNYFPRSGDT